MGQEKPPSTLVSEENTFFPTTFLFFVLKVPSHQRLLCRSYRTCLLFCHSFPFFTCMEEKDAFPGKTAKKEFSFWIANQQQKCAVSFAVICETVKSSIFSSCLDIFLFTDVKPVFSIDIKSKHIKVLFSKSNKTEESCTMLANKRYLHCNFTFCHLL